MVQLIIMGVFFGGLVVGAAIAEASGHLPTVEELAEQDRQRFTRYRDEL